MHERKAILVNWLSTLVLAVGISIFAWQPFPSEMTGWDRLHLVLPLMSSAGLMLLARRTGSLPDRVIFFYLLSQVALLCAIGLLIKPPTRPVPEILSLFVAVPAGMLLAAGGRSAWRRGVRTETGCAPE